MSNYVIKNLLPQTMKDNLSNAYSATSDLCNKASQNISYYTSKYAIANVASEIAQFAGNIAFNAVVSSFISNINSHKIVGATGKVAAANSKKTIVTDLTYKGKIAVAAANVLVNKFFDAGYDHSISSLAYSFGGKIGKVVALGTEAYSSYKSNQDAQEDNIVTIMQSCNQYVGKNNCDAVANLSSKAYNGTSYYFNEACNAVGAGDYCENISAKLAGFSFPVENQ